MGNTINPFSWRLKSIIYWNEILYTDSFNYSHLYNTNTLIFNIIEGYFETVAVFQYFYFSTRIFRSFNGNTVHIMMLAIDTANEELEKSYEIVDPVKVWIRKRAQEIRWERGMEERPKIVWASPQEARRMHYWINILNYLRRTIPFNNTSKIKLKSTFKTLKGSIFRNIFQPRVFFLNNNLKGTGAYVFYHPPYYKQHYIRTNVLNTPKFKGYITSTSGFKVRRAARRRLYYRDAVRKLITPAGRRLALKLAKKNRFKNNLPKPILKQKKKAKSNMPVLRGRGFIKRVFMTSYLIKLYGLSLYHKKKSPINPPIRLSREQKLAKYKKLNESVNIIAKEDVVINDIFDIYNLDERKKKRRWPRKRYIPFELRSRLIFLKRTIFIIYFRWLVVFRMKRALTRIITMYAGPMWDVTICLRFKATSNYVDAYLMTRFLMIKLAQGFNPKPLLQRMAQYLNSLVYRINLISGFKVILMGRFTRRDRAYYGCKQVGAMGYNAKLSQIDYRRGIFILPYSLCIVHVWLSFDFDITTLRGGLKNMNRIIWSLQYINHYHKKGRVPKIGFLNFK